MMKKDISANLSEMHDSMQQDSNSHWHILHIFSNLNISGTDADIREFIINNMTAAKMPQNLHTQLTKTKVLHTLHVLVLFLYISFSFSANLHCELTISQVLQRT